MKIEIISLKDKAGEKVEVIGWINRYRKHSKVGFIDLYDRTTKIQVVVNEELLKLDLSLEDLIEVKGEVKDRSESTQNPELDLGLIEMEAESIKIISTAADLPFSINETTQGIDENLRMKYRYLDLRTKRMQDNLKNRAKLAKGFRNFFDDKGFIEVETPALTKGTPEGAREYMVPSRLYPGEGYVLPQSPQQFKQLLMVGGIEKYYQLAKCFRDEDSRSDRQPEFTQLDIEMSFCDKQEVMDLTELAMISVIEEAFPHLNLPEGDFPVLTYAKSMEKHGSDKPDLRKDKKDSKELAFVWVIDQPMFEIGEEDKKITAVHHPFTHPDVKNVKDLENDKEILNIKALSYDLVLNGFEIAGGSIRIHDSKLQHRVFEILGMSEKETNERFGHMLEAFKYSPPPHGGIAVGFDRLIAILQNEASIREVIAFPKTSEARDLLMGAPSEMSDKALKALNIKKIN